MENNHHIAGFDTVTMPVIINASTIRNYSQDVPKWDNLKNISSTLEF